MAQGQAPGNQAELLKYMIVNGAVWVQEQRDLHRPNAIELDDPTREEFGRFFDVDILDQARFRTVHAIENPGFYTALRQAGHEIPLDFSQMLGITFGDMVLFAGARISSTPFLPLLFHECVHVEQYYQLGVDEFVRRYVTGWAENGFQYSSIPLERDAYELQAKFESQPKSGFSVRDEVANRLGDGR